MNVVPNQTIILGLQVFLDHRSLSSIDQKFLMTPPPPPTPHPPFFDLSRPLEVICMSSETYSSSFVLLYFCLLFGHLSSCKFIFVQFHLSIFFSFTGRYWAVALDGLRSSVCNSKHLNSPLEVDFDEIFYVILH